MYNRKQRRDIEKASGLLKEYQGMNAEQKSEIRLRRKMVGDQIHLQFLQEQENLRLEAAAECEAKMIQNYIADGKTEEEAKRIIENNHLVAQRRFEKLRKRNEKK